MLRRALPGVCCILLALLLGIPGEIYLRTSAKRLLDTLEISQDAEETEIFAAAREALELWKNREKLLSAIIKHSDADALGVLFTRLENGIGNRDPGETLACVENCAAQVRVLLAGERLCWENILFTGVKNDGKVFTFISI